MAATHNAMDASFSLRGQSWGPVATSWRGDQHSFQDSDQFLAELCLRNGVTAGGRRTGPVPVEETPQGTLPSPQQEPTLKDTQEMDLSPTCPHQTSLTTDDDSYVRTDDEEEGANTDWEENMRRWVNR
ncbi:hypothetical protein HPB47_005143 [Ixodes persulcatus]|uniref:Uncharacterized protein n=1 Tax=Ixodes persulcatus TaxID=34615 RepID=A0AC60PDR9_IXOPE|nr:hypothetical protein HPB47_005143 [Ixodes persulcatus]